MTRPKKRPLTEARERVLTAAEELFMQRGYNAVTMQDIARALGIRQASLYYHAPGGKEELFVSIMERTLLRHQSGLSSALASADADLAAQLRAASRWFLSQQPLNLLRMMRSDMPSLQPESAMRLQGLVYGAIMAPMRGIFAQAVKRGGSRPFDPDAMAGAFLSSMDGVWAAAHVHGAGSSTDALADELIDMFLYGLVPCAARDACPAATGHPAAEEPPVA